MFSRLIANVRIFSIRTVRQNGTNHTTYTGTFVPAVTQIIHALVSKNVPLHSCPHLHRMPTGFLKVGFHNRFTAVNLSRIKPVAVRCIAKRLTPFTHSVV